MTGMQILAVIGIYFGVLMLISWLTSRGANNDSFFLGNRKSPWFVVAFGMIGASLSGVTFISIPGWVDGASMGYMQVVFGYLVGYFVIALVLMPLYYKLNVTSIYSYLKDRLGNSSYKTGAAFFLLSRVLGAAFRLYLVAIVLQKFVFDDLGVHFSVTVALSIAFIWLYTFRGGIKTIIWTDTLQTLFMLVSLGVSIYLLGSEMDMGIGEMATKISESEYSNMFFFDDVNSKSYFVKQFLAGIFIAICMTGLDQDMMQKNLSCKDVGAAKKNMISFSIVLVFVNLLFLVLGALLYMWATETGFDLPFAANAAGEMVLQTDQVYPSIALNGGLGMGLGIVFLLGLIAAAYSSADSALTSLTTSICIDFLDIEKRDAKEKERLRKTTHIGMSLVLLVVIIIFKYTMDRSVIQAVLGVASYTYGPLLGLFAFGIFTKFQVKDKLVPLVCILSPALCYILSTYSPEWFGGYKWGYEILILNGGITFFGLWLLRLPKAAIAKVT
jgi:Na+/proline symporter